MPLFIKNRPNGDETPSPFPPHGQDWASAIFIGGIVMVLTFITVVILTLGR